MALIRANKIKTALLLIDIQSGFRVPDHFGTQRNNNSLEQNVELLVNACRKWNSTHSSTAGDESSCVDIIHVRHHSANPKSPLHPSFVLPDDATVRGIDLLPCAKEADGEVIFTKNVNSAFIGTSLEQYLRERRVRQLLVCGITTDHCVSTTVRMAANLKVVDNVETGERGTIFLIQDGCATFGKGKFTADLIHDVHVESLKGEFAEITKVRDVVEHVLAP